MRAIMLARNEYHLRDTAVPGLRPQDVLIKVAYAGINRADLLQLQGRYPLPESGVPGLELSGEVTACGIAVTSHKIGDKVCALVSEGAFAEYAAVAAAQVLPVPAPMDYRDAAALPEACFTTWVSLVWQAHVQEGESVLIHGGAGGIGSLAVQIARQLGARVFTTSGTDEKCDLCRTLGAHAINYNKQDFDQVIQRETGGKGVDVILDMVGGDYLPRNLASLAQNGRLCIIAFIKGAQASANFSPVLLKHLSIMGSTLRPRSAQEKAVIAAELREKLWDFMGVQNGIKPLIAKVFPLEEAEKALAFMHEGLNVGKILLKM